MEKKDWKQFLSTMYKLGQEMGANLKDIDFDFKFDALKEYSLDEFNKGCTWLVKNRKQHFPAFPRVSEIIEAIQIINPPVPPAAQAELECDKVLNFLNLHGSSKQFKSDNPVTQYLMGRVWGYNSGWARKVKEKELVWFRKDFTKRWEKISEERNIEKITHSSQKLLNFELKKITE